MDIHERTMIAAVNRNHEDQAFARRLSAISARRRHRKSVFSRRK